MKTIEKRMCVDDAIQMGYIPKKGDEYINLMGKKCIVTQIFIDYSNGYSFEHTTEGKNYESVEPARQLDGYFKFNVTFLKGLRITMY